VSNRVWTEATAGIPRLLAQVGAMPADVGCGDVNDVGIELGEILAYPWRQAERKAILRATRERHRRQADEIAGRLERRLIDRGRIDTDMDALPQQIVYQAIEGAVRAVAHAVVIARNQGDADFVGLHGGCT